MSPDLEWGNGDEMTMSKYDGMDQKERELWVADSLNQGHRKFKAIKNGLDGIEETLTNIDDTLKQLPCKSNPGLHDEVQEHVADETIHQKKINWNEVFHDPKVVGGIIISVGTLLTIITALILG